MTEDAGLEMPGIATYVKCYEPDKVEIAMAGCAALGAPALRVGARPRSLAAAWVMC